MYIYTYIYTYYNGISAGGEHPLRAASPTRRAPSYTNTNTIVI